MTSRNLHVKAPGFLVLFLFLCAGCGGQNGERGEVHGTVQLNGLPLQQGSILFVPESGTRGVVAGSVIAEGYYRIAGRDGPAVGGNRVEIRASRKSGRLEAKPYGRPGETIEQEEEAVAKSYNTDSTLKVEIRPGTNEKDFQVTGAPVRPHHTPRRAGQESGRRR